MLGPAGVSRHLQQMPSHREQEMVTGDPLIVVERSEKGQAGEWPLHHADRNGSIDRGHRIRGHIVGPT